MIDHAGNGLGSPIAVVSADAGVVQKSISSTVAPTVTVCGAGVPSSPSTGWGVNVNVPAAS